MSSSVGPTPPKTSLPLKPVKPIKRDEPNFSSGTDKPAHRRKVQVVKQEPNPEPIREPTREVIQESPNQSVQEAPPERVQPTPQMRAPTPEEVQADPLVKTVLDVFEGEIKRVHPKRR